MKKYLVSIILTVFAAISVRAQTAQTSLNNAIANGYGSVAPTDLQSIMAYAWMQPVGIGQASSALSNALVNGYGALSPGDLQSVIAYGAATGGSGGGPTNGQTAAQVQAAISSNWNTNSGVAGGSMSVGGNLNLNHNAVTNATAFYNQADSTFGPYIDLGSPSLPTTIKNPNGLNLFVGSGVFQIDHTGAVSTTNSITAGSFIGNLIGSASAVAVNVGSTSPVELVGVNLSGSNVLATGMWTGGSGTTNTSGVLVSPGGLMGDLTGNASSATVATNIALWYVGETNFIDPNGWLTDFKPCKRVLCEVEHKL